MEIVEQLLTEASEKAGTPEGFLRLIRLIIEEVERIDVRSPDAPRQYVALLRAYVLVKRQLGYFNHRCEIVEIDRSIYVDTIRRLKYAIKTKRDEAREYAARSIPPEKLKELKRFAGTHLEIRPTEFAVSIPLKETSYMGQVRVRFLKPADARPSGHSYNRMTS